MAEPSASRLVLGGLLLLLGVAVVAVGAALGPATALAVHAAATLASLVQGLLQRRFGPRIGLPGLGALPIATALGASMALAPPLDAVLWWPVATALALLAGLLLAALSLWLGQRVGLREPLPAMASPVPAAVAPGPAPAPARPAWRPLGGTGLLVRTDEYGERGMGGPPHVAHTLSVGLCLPGEDAVLSADERWWIVSGPWEESVVAVDLQVRVMFSAPRETATVLVLRSAPISMARLERPGFERVCAYRVRDDGLWWPEDAPEPLTDAAFGPPAAGLRRVALVDRQRLLDAGDAFAYAQQPQWRIEGPEGPLPLQLAHRDIDDAVWRADGAAALIPTSHALDGGPAPTRWYLWQARGVGRWVDFGNGWGSGVPGTGTPRPCALEDAHVDVEIEVGTTHGIFPAWSAASTLDGAFGMGPLPWFEGVDARGWPRYSEISATVSLRSRRRLDHPADDAGRQPVLSHHASGATLQFDALGPVVDPREVRPFRLRHGSLVLDGVCPVPYWLDPAGRFVVVQGVQARALAPVLHLVDLGTARVSTLRRDVAELRLQAAHDGELQWIELRGQRPIDAPPDPLVPLERPPGHNAWNRREADHGRVLALRGRRARLDAEAGALALLPPWTECEAPVSPLHPGDVLYRPPQGGDVLLLGAHGERQDAWPRESEPQIGGRLLTREGHAISDVALGMIASADGRWLLFARCRPAIDNGRSVPARIEDWEIALLDRRAHVLHARPGVHFGGLPFFQAFDGERIRVEVSPEPWWRPGMARESRAWTLPGLLSQLDGVPLRGGDGLWRLPGDPVPASAWRRCQRTWQDGRWE